MDYISETERLKLYYKGFYKACKTEQIAIAYLEIMSDATDTTTLSAEKQQDKKHRNINRRVSRSVFVGTITVNRNIIQKKTPTNLTSICKDEYSCNYVKKENLY